MPTGRESAAAALATDGGIYVVGGWDGSTTLAVNERFDVSTNSWSSRKPLPAPRQGAGAVAARNGLIYVIGGATGNVPSSTVEAYDPVTDTWSEKSPMPLARLGLATVLGGDGKIYAMGGSPNAGCDGSRDVQVYDPALDTWSTGNRMRVARMQFGAVTAANGRAFVIGGIHVVKGKCVWLSSVESASLGHGSWQREVSLPVARNLLAAAAGPDGRIYAIGGNVPGIGTVAENDSLDPAG